MNKDDKLREYLRNLYDELEQIQLPYVVTEKLDKLMDKHDIKRKERSRGVSAA